MSKFTLFLGKILPERINRELRKIRDTHLRKTTNIKLPSDIYDQSLQFHKVSFCTNIMNRTYQLKQTYLENINHNLNYPNVEFVLVNYNSSDDLDDWVRNNLMGFIKKGIVRYYKTNEPESYHLCKAKNLAHRLATGDILCNLDGDNFTGSDFAYYLNYLFNRESDTTIFQFTKPPYWGTVGRIAIHKNYFYDLGGYDESFYPVGHDDIDFLDRAKSYGLRHKVIKIPNFLKYISNSTTEKVENSGFDKKDYYGLEKINMKKSKNNIEKGILKANSNDWLLPKVYLNFEKEPFKF